MTAFMAFMDSLDDFIPASSQKHHWCDVVIYIKVDNIGHEVSRHKTDMYQAYVDKIVGLFLLLLGLAWDYSSSS